MPGVVNSVIYIYIYKFFLVKFNKRLVKFTLQSKTCKIFIISLLKDGKMNNLLVNFPFSTCNLLAMPCKAGILC